MSYQVRRVITALIRVTSSEPFGKDNLVMWTGYPHDVDYDGESIVDCSKITVLNAKEYIHHHNSDITYSLGQAQQIKGPCANLENGNACFCNGDCMTDAPDGLKTDKRYFLAKEVSH